MCGRLAGHVTGHVAGVGRGGARTELDPALLEAAWGMTGYVAGREGHDAACGEGTGNGMCKC